MFGQVKREPSGDPLDELREKIKQIEGRLGVYQLRLQTQERRDHLDDKLASHVASVSAVAKGLSDSVELLTKTLRECKEVVDARNAAKEEYAQGLRDGATIAVEEGLVAPPMALMPRAAKT